MSLQAAFSFILWICSVPLILFRRKADGWQEITFDDASANPLNVGADCDILYIGDELVPAFEVSTWEGLYAALGRGGCFKLTADAVPGNPYWADALVVPDGVIVRLDLNGHIVDRGYTEADYDGSVIKILGGTLTVTDSAPAAEHKVAVPATDPVEYADAVTYVDPVSNNTVAVKGGIITGGFTEQYGGVYVFDGVLNFEGGTIVGNGAGKKKNSVEGAGGGVFIQNGTFNMSGGAIVGNKAYNIPPVWVGTDPLGKGGGVFVANGTFNMSGGIISGNEAGEIAGGVYIGKDGTFNMTAGMIFGNVAPGNNEIPYANNIVNKGGSVNVLIQLTLDPNYTGGDIMEQMLLFDVKTTIAACTFTREGYTFQGWATQTDGSGTQYSDGAEITLSEPLTLYAKWKAEKYTITFKNEDGTVLQTCSVDYDSMPAYAGETPTKDSSGNIVYTFIGWTPSVTTVKGEAEYTAKFGIATDSTCDECGSVLYIDPDASTDDNHYLFCFNPNCTECGVQAAESAHSGTASCGSKAVCTVCGVEFGDVDANNHVNKKHIPAVDATCTKGGNIEHWYCSDCGNYYSDAECTHKINFNDTQIPKKDHGNKVYFPTVDATCTEDGNIEYWYCPDCSIYYSNEECTNIITLSDAVTEKTGHADKEHIPAVDATCTEDGNIEYWYCPDCGIYYSDEACTTAVEQSDTIVKAKGHEWDGGSVTMPATCTEDGVITYKCKHDASHFYTETVKAKGHTPGEPVVENEIAATCTEEGSCDLVTYCSVCGAELERTTVRTEALGHDFWAWAETPATCTEDGVETRVCSRDPSHYETRGIAAKGHIPGSPVTENEVAATCTEAGSHDLVTYCTVCGAELERTTVRTEALGHDYGEWTVTAPATCTEDGVETRVCSRDPSHYETRGIPATGHLFGNWSVKVEPTETEAGLKVRVCSVCGMEETEAIPALGESGKIEYEFKVEPEKEWKAESGNDFVLISVADFSTFIGAKVDGSYLDSRYYVAEEGSTKVTFKAEYLETLTSGDHTLSVVSEDGEAKAVVSIIASPDTPDIPDVPDVPDIPETTDAPEVPGESGKSPVVWIIVAAVGVAAIAVATVIVVKKRKAK